VGRAHQLPATKTCYCCKQEKGLTDFHAKKSSRDGRSGECKECKRESARSYREANPEKVAEQNAGGMRQIQGRLEVKGSKGMASQSSSTTRSRSDKAVDVRMAIDGVGLC
jgi:hypothetical protein